MRRERERKLMTAGPWASLINVTKCAIYSVSALLHGSGGRVETLAAAAAGASPSGEGSPWIASARGIINSFLVTLVMVFSWRGASTRFA